MAWPLRRALQGFYSADPETFGTNIQMSICCMDTESIVCDERVMCSRFLFTGCARLLFLWGIRAGVLGMEIPKELKT